MLPAAHRETESPTTTEPRRDRFLKGRSVSVQVTCKITDVAFAVTLAINTPPPSALQNAPPQPHSFGRRPLRLFLNLRWVLKAASNIARAVKAVGSNPLGKDSPLILFNSHSNPKKL